MLVRNGFTGNNSGKLEGHICRPQYVYAAEDENPSSSSRKAVNSLGDPPDCFEHCYLEITRLRCD